MDDFAYYSVRAKKQSIMAAAAGNGRAAAAHMAIAVGYAERAALAMNRIMQGRLTPEESRSNIRLVERSDRNISPSPRVRGIGVSVRREKAA